MSALSNICDANASRFSQAVAPAYPHVSEPGWLAWAGQRITDTFTVISSRVTLSNARSLAVGAASGIQRVSMAILVPIGGVCSRTGRAIQHHISAEARLRAELREQLGPRKIEVCRLLSELLALKLTQDVNFGQSMAQRAVSDSLNDVFMLLFRTVNSRQDTLQNDQEAVQTLLNGAISDLNGHFSAYNAAHRGLVNSRSGSRAEQCGRMARAFQSPEITRLHGELLHEAMSDSDDPGEVDLRGEVYVQSMSSDVVRTILPVFEAELPTVGWRLPSLTACARGLYGLQWVRNALNIDEHIEVELPRVIATIVQKMFNDLLEEQTINRIALISFRAALENVNEEHASENNTEDSEPTPQVSEIPSINRDALGHAAVSGLRMVAPTATSLARGSVSLLRRLGLVNTSLEHIVGVQTGQVLDESLFSRPASFFEDKIYDALINKLNDQITEHHRIFSVPAGEEREAVLQAIKEEVRESDRIVREELAQVISECTDAWVSKATNAVYGIMQTKVSALFQALKYALMSIIRPFVSISKDLDGALIFLEKRFAPVGPFIRISKRVISRVTQHALEVLTRIIKYAKLWIEARPFTVMFKARFKKIKTDMGNFFHMAASKHLSRWIESALTEVRHPIHRNLLYCLLDRVIASMLPDVENRDRGINALVDAERLRRDNEAAIERQRQLQVTRETMPVPFEPIIEDVD